MEKENKQVDPRGLRDGEFGDAMRVLDSPPKEKVPFWYWREFMSLRGSRSIEDTIKEFNERFEVDSELKDNRVDAADY